MVKEGAYAEENQNDSIERKAGFSEKTLREFLETHRSISNSGHNGIIMKFLNSELPPDIQETIEFDREENPEGSLSVKALKIYNLGDAKREFDALKEARDIVKNRNNGASPLARVPKASAFYDIEVSGNFQTFLNNNGASIVDGKVGLIVMDYIEGVDLATLLYQEALKRLHTEDDMYAVEHINTMPFEELAQTVAAKFHFSKAGGKSRNEREQLFEEEKVKTENAKKLFSALEKTGFVLPLAIVEQIQNTVKLFHANNFYHNDLHERQVIIKDGDLENPQAFIIDYGTATENRESTGDANIKPMDDEALARRLSPLTKSLEEKRKEKESEVTREWNDRISGIDKQPRLGKQYSDLEAAFKSNKLNLIEEQFALFSSSDTDLKNFLAILIKISRENPGNRDEIVSFLSTHENDKRKRPFFLKQLEEAKRAIQ